LPPVEVRLKVHQTWWPTQVTGRTLADASHIILCFPHMAVEQSLLDQASQSRLAGMPYCIVNTSRYRPLWPFPAAVASQQASLHITRRRLSVVVAVLVLVFVVGVCSLVLSLLSCVGDWRQRR